MQNAEEPKGFAIDLTLRELNPNHKYRMVLMRTPPNYWLAELGVVKSDDSLYLMPLIKRGYAVDISDATGHRSQYQVLPNSGLHVSFHDSGSVNVSFGTQRIPLRKPTDTRATLGPVFAVVVNSTAGLAEATGKEINSAPARRRVLPLLGAWRPGPVGITVYRSSVGADWTAPILADLFQANVHLPVRGKSVQYHVAVWQHQNFQPPPCELAIYWAEK